MGSHVPHQIFSTSCPFAWTLMPDYMWHLALCKDSSPAPVHAYMYTEQQFLRRIKINHAMGKDHGCTRDCLAAGSARLTVDTQPAMLTMLDAKPRPVLMSINLALTTWTSAKKARMQWHSAAVLPLQ